MGTLKSSKPYWRRVLLVFDQGLNVILLNGHEDNTISSHVGYNAIHSNKKRWKVCERVINMLFWFEPEHCYNSIEWGLYR